MSDDVKALIAEASEAADKIHRWAFGDDSELADRSAVRFEVERITDALEAAQQAPVVDREALENALGVALANAYDDDSVVTVEESVAGQLLASGILQDAAEVEARGLEKAAEEIREQMIADELALHDITYSAELPQHSKIMLNGAQRFMERQFARAQQVREGN